MKKICLIFYFYFFLSYFLFSQNVGIGTTTPIEKLHVAGNVKADTVKPNAIKLSPNAGAGKILTSDAEGNANWQTINSTAGGSVGFGPWGDCSTNAIGDYNPVVDTTGAASDFFGRSVSISGNYAIAGAYGDDGPAGIDQGSASIFQYNGSNWVMMQKIFDATGAPGDFFGWTVSISGNYAIVGSYGDDVGANTDQGSASIYQLTGGTWVLMQKITDPGGAAGDFFGWTVSVSGNYTITGAYGDDDFAGADQGSVSIFQFNGSNWILMNKLTDAAGAANDRFGISVSVSGSYAIAGAYTDDVGANADQGSASIYQYNGSNWVLMNKITDATGAASDNFGRSVSISGNYVIVGALNDDVGANPDQGSASFFQFNGVNWVVMQKVTDAAGSLSDFFGVSVSISGNYAIVGAFADDVGTNVNYGSSTIYQRMGMGWTKLQFVTDPGGNSADFLGIEISIDGNNKRFLVGAYGYANSSGKAIFGKIN
jgi:hypothetical protein